ncbi:MAG: DUF1549 domain-containing protein, partial [Planctomycetota bacterium]
MKLFPILVFGLALLYACQTRPSRAESKGSKVSFQRDVRPILSNYCYPCHGPDEGSRRAKLRLDVRSLAVSVQRNPRVIVPGRAEESELVRRIRSSDPSYRMPPPASAKEMSPEEREVITRWIESGAAYEAHWAFQAPKRVQVPEMPEDPKLRVWANGAIDRFILRALVREGLRPSPRADAETLLRRVYLDLVGLPPGESVRRNFLRDPSAPAYEAIVDQLLASSDYGERWARRWLDLARYADTNGYEKDRNRSIWPFRDWVIRALNRDMPFDQFSIEQLAGDMLPNPTQAQLVATGFHRNTMINEEGGIDPLEFRFRAMTDRVATTGTTWLGLTTGCAQCHTHKFDPLTHTEYFGLMAFLNNADEPEIALPSEGDRAAEIERARRIDELLSKLETRWPVDGEPKIDQAFETWVASQHGLAVDW